MKTLYSAVDRNTQVSPWVETREKALVAVHQYGRGTVQSMDFPETEGERMFGPRDGKADEDLIMDGPVALLRKKAGKAK